MAKLIREQLIKHLSTGRFISGQTLGDYLGVSRAAISNHVKALVDMGLDVFRVTGKGYKLAQPLVLLDANKIQAHLALLKLKNLIEVHSIIDSTNNYLLRRIPSQVQKGQVCIAEYQQAGRGRRGRQWVSPFGSHIYLSMYWPLEQGMSEAMGLSLVIGLAISDVLKSLIDSEIQLKWPNDIYIAGKKVAGILIDLEGQAQGLSHCVIGVGINIKMSKLSAQHITQPWTDLSEYSQKKIDRNILVANIIHSISVYLKKHQSEGFSTLLNEWHQQDIFLNRPVKIITGEKETFGIYRGVNEQGAMMLEVLGKIIPVYGGEVSLRSVDEPIN